MELIFSNLKHALMITGFVLVMMLAVEYINVQTRGSWKEKLSKKKSYQYFSAAFLGALPGCLGAFTVVAMYTHGAVGFGAIVAAMIATSGDEAYVMFSLFPVTALLLAAFLFLIGIFAGYLTDLFFAKRKKVLPNFEHEFKLHEKDFCKCYDSKKILSQLKNLSAKRFLLTVLLAALITSNLFGWLGPKDWNWVKVTVLAGSTFALFIALTSPDHFIDKHIWDHILKKHLLSVLLWTFGALLVVSYIENFIDLKEWIRENYFIVLIVASLVGIIPESGPHLIFVTLFANGTLPLGILLANSISQDGHGSLPLLAVSKKSFIIMKVINIVFALTAGLIFYFFFH